MPDWKTLMNEAMQLESNDTIAAFAKFKLCIDAATSATQTSLDSNPSVGIAMESVYGALAAYAQQVMMELQLFFRILPYTQLKGKRVCQNIIVYQINVIFTWLYPRERYV